MENNRCNSMKSGRSTLVFMFVILVLVMCSQWCPADCRALRPPPETTTATAAASGSCEEVNGTATDKANNLRSSTRRLRGLAFILASGPSKRGPGH
ncbi:hypothetical protein CASFOL_034847 [Castilleja foliolosa]|uniref:Secreted protein n=1 Tax=Castilleja foliolosa TaxID=1961234 RepID=A0ABD3BR09_9LAMI